MTWFLLAATVLCTFTVYGAVVAGSRYDKLYKED